MEPTISGSLEVIDTVAELNTFVTYELCAAGAALFGHGICLFLFAFAIFYLQKTKTWTSRMFLVLAIILVLFAFAQVSLDVASAAMFLRMTELVGEGSREAAVAPYEAYWHITLARQALTSINNAITDSLLLYRCAIIWGPSPYTRVVTGVSLLLILSTLGLGMWGTFGIEDSTPIPFIMALVTNSVLLGLTAGKIWRKGRQTTIVLGAEAGKRYNTTLEIVCESSLLYLIFVLVYLISSVSSEFSLLTGVAWGALAQVVNIVPMLIMVRVGMARDAAGPDPNPRRFYGGNESSSSKFGMTQMSDLTTPLTLRSGGYSEI
ncbi:hypothetical protein MSAN_00242700 [Mycena sanguinolenta]|uniref:Uncharacterized protein n=1 Tax=Mycena sanguinolenta TaxID=230812 RepID=A0A8H6ZI23_9AGAR|nr:hypothetical protein MSAN_00242700 [Mycena sanguinolenta]